MREKEKNLTNYWRFQVLLLFSSQHHDFHGDYYIFLQECAANRANIGEEPWCLHKLLVPFTCWNLRLLCSLLGSFLLKWIWGLWKVLDWQYRLEPSVYSHLSYWDSSPTVWDPLLPTDLKGRPPTIKEGQMPPPWQRLRGSPLPSAACANPTLRGQQQPSGASPCRTPWLADGDFRKESGETEWWKIIQGQRMGVLSTSYNS